MQSVQKKEVSIHPLVSAMHLKKDYSNTLENVVVIETAHDLDEMEYSARDEYMMNLLADLHDLRMQAERKFGKIDRIDIRAH